MKINSPCCITSRLLPGITIAGSEISIEYAGSTSDGRTRYRWFIDIGKEFTGNDLKSGCQGGGLQSGLESLLSFMEACGEAHRYAQRTGRPGENADLFPVPVAEWCYQHSNELGMARLEIEESETPAIEEN
jgi:hypothetical protein